MKKIIILLLLTLFLLPLTFISATASSEIEAIVVSLDLPSNSMQVLLGDEYEENMIVYEIYLSNTCAVDNFKNGDFLNIESADSYFPQIGDKIKGRISLFDLSFDISEIDNFEQTFENCEIIAALAKTDKFYDAYLMAKIAENAFALESMYGDEYLLENQNICLVSELGDISMIITEQQKEQLSQDDKILLGMQMDFKQLSFQFKDLKNCLIGQVYPVISNEIEYLYTEGDNIIIDDLELGKKLSIKVAPDCKILNQTDYFYGEIIYLDDNDQYANPLYLAFLMNFDESLTDFSDLIKDNACKILDWSVIESYEPSYDYAPPCCEIIYEDLYQRPTANINIPEVVNYYIGQYGKKVYTDRPKPENMIGALVKGETDPATYIVDTDAKLRWLKTEDVAYRLFGDGWDQIIIWFNDSIIYTYEFGKVIEQ